MEKISQQEFVKAIKAHYHWIEQDVDGWEKMKADFSGKDLSGIDLAAAAKEAKIVDRRFDDTQWEPTDLVILDGAELSGADLHGLKGSLSLMNADLTGADMSHMHLDHYWMGTDLSGANLSGADFSHSEINGLWFGYGADCTETDFSDTVINGRKKNAVVFSGSVLQKTNFANAKIVKGDFTKAEIKDCTFDGADLMDSDFRETVLTNVSFDRADLSRSNFSGVDLTRTTFKDANLGWADLRRADLRDIHKGYVRERDFTGHDLHGACLTGANIFRVQFRGANLKGAALCGQDLQETDLRGTNLSGADLSGANMRKAMLSDSDLSLSVLNRADLSDADLRRVRMNMASMKFVNLAGANMCMSDMKDASVHMTDFSGASMSESTIELKQLLTSRYDGVDFSRTTVLTDGWDKIGAWDDCDRLFDMVENCIRHDDGRNKTETGLICAVLESDPYSVLLIDEATAQHHQSIEDKPKIAAAYDKACDRLYDILEKQGLVYSDSKTHVMLLDSAEKTSIYGKYDTRAMRCLGMMEKGQMRLTVRNSGKFYYLDEQKGSRLESVVPLSKAKSIDAIKETLKDLIIERAGLPSRDLMEDLREMNAQLDSFAGREKDMRIEKTKTELSGQTM